MEDFAPGLSGVTEPSGPHFISYLPPTTHLPALACSLLTASLRKSLQFVAPCRPAVGFRGFQRPTGLGVKWPKSGITEERKRLFHLHGMQLYRLRDQGAATWPVLSTQR